jgi:putative PIN family toxin of toxin-antitoxin system
VKLVLDTNVVIDWLVFDDPFLALFREAVSCGRITVVTHQHAVDELRRVLGYRALKLDEARRARILERYHAQTSAPDTAASSANIAVELPRGFPRCRDADDTPFLSLAWQAKADALVSRDNAVLALRRRAPRFGFQIFDVPQMMAAVATVVADAADAALISVEGADVSRRFGA